MKTLNIVDDIYYEKKIKIDKNSNYINWNRYEKKNLKSIINYIESNEFYFQKKYIEFISDIKHKIFFKKTLAEHFIIDKNFSLWEMSLFEEKNVYKNPEINELIKILALKEIVKKKKIKKIIINSNNIKLKSNIMSILNKKNIKFNYIGQQKNNDKNFLRNNLFYYFYYIFFFFLKRYSFKNNSYLLKKDAILIIDYFTYFNEDKARKGIYDSVFWKNLLPYLNNNEINLNFLHITLDNKNDRFSDYFKILKAFNNKKNISHNILDSQINFNIFFKVFYKWILNFFKYQIFKIRYSNTYIFESPLLNNIFRDSIIGVWSIKNLFFFYLFKNFFQSKSFNPKVSIYVNEFQGWEKSLIYNLKKFNNNNNIYGLQFNPIRNWDLRYKFFTNSKNFNLYPNNIITSYYSSKNKLKKNFSKMKNFKIYICKNLRPLTVNFTNSKVLKKKKILVVGDHDDHSTINLLTLVNKLNFFYKDIIFEYKPHPASKINLFNFKNLKKMKIFYNNECFKKRYSFYLVSNKTTLGLDLISKNLKTAVMLDQDTLNFSPVDKNYKFFIKNEKEFKNFINTKINYNKTTQKKEKLSWTFMVKIWKNILKKKDE